jgi:hypothetical protein
VPLIVGVLWILLCHTTEMVGNVAMPSHTQQIYSQHIRGLFKLTNMSKQMPASLQRRMRSDRIDDCGRDESKIKRSRCWKSTMRVPPRPSATIESGGVFSFGNRLALLFESGIKRRLPCQVIEKPSCH